MTDQGIVQAMRCISTICKVADRKCKECGYFRNGFGCNADKISTDAADLIERLTAENAALREKVPQWVSVEDRLPIDRLKKYLVAFRDAGGPIVDMARYFPSDGWTCDNWDVPQKLITHWMPLPGAPEKGEKA